MTTATEAAVLARDCAELRARVSGLEAALKPFAELADQVAREALTSPTDASSGLLTVVYGDLRRASEALHKPLSPQNAMDYFDNLARNDPDWQKKSESAKAELARISQDLDMGY